MSLDTDYLATTRSNYFRINDEAAFHAFCETLNLRYWKHTIEPGEKPHYAITADIGGQSRGWPSETWMDNEPVDVDLPAELDRFLDPRDVAVLMEVGMRCQPPAPLGRAPRMIRSLGCSPFGNLSRS